MNLVDGNEAIALGAVAAGCNFFAGYPITPATTIYAHLLRLLPARGGIAMQGEDEIASMGFCLGAAMCGKKVMTATSGPGMSLYSEQLSFALGSEIPLVIVDVQRLGPSTGSATRGADGDIQFLRWGSSGGMPIIVLAPTNVRDCFVLTLEAFNLAEEYRCPVIIASNKEIATTNESVDLQAIQKPAIKNRAAYSGRGKYRPFAIPEGRLVPDFLPFGADQIVRCISSTHGPDGYITTDAEEIGACRERMRDKLLTTVEKYSLYEACINERAETLVITYGVTARSARVVFDELHDTDAPISLLVLKTLWPAPEKVIESAAKGVKRVVVVEMNLGAYLYEIQRILRGKQVDFCGRMDGRLLTPQRIREVVANG